jgi:hypothetical protein
MERHHALTESALTPEGLAAWIKNASKDSFMDERKEFYEPDEISEMEKVATECGTEIMRLNDLKKTFLEMVTKGNAEEYFIMEIPQTVGIKLLTEQRERLYREVHRGYKVVDTKIYAIPNEDGNLYFFDIEGNLVEDRTRKLNQREKNDYFGMFALHSNEESRKQSNE